MLSGIKWLMGTIVVLGVVLAGMAAPRAQAAEPIYALPAASIDGEWPYCVVDVEYTPELQFTVEGNVIRGQAIQAGNPSFPAPITGSIHGTQAKFAVGYLNDNMRFYEMNTTTGEGRSWLIVGSSSSFFDPPHPTSVVPCGLNPGLATEAGDGPP